VNNGGSGAAQARQTGEAEQTKPSRIEAVVVAALFGTGSSTAAHVSAPASVRILRERCSYRSQCDQCACRCYAE
jgi:hypothetical protein